MSELALRGHWRCPECKGWRSSMGCCECVCQRNGVELASPPSQRALSDVAFLKKQSDEMKNTVTVKSGLPAVYWRDINKQPPPTRVKIESDEPVVTKDAGGAAVLTWTIIGVVLAALAMLMGSCAAQPRKMTALDELRQKADTAWPVQKGVAAALLDAQPLTIYAHAIVRHGQKLADVPGGLPLAHIEGRPLAGKPFRIGWTTRPTAPFPDARTALLVTTTPPEGEHPIIGGRGAHLTVPPDTVLVPNDKRVPFLTQHDGRVELSITFPASSVGSTFWLQLLVADTRTGAGFTPSPVVAIMVGDR